MTMRTADSHETCDKDESSYLLHLFFAVGWDDALLGFVLAVRWLLVAWCLVEAARY